MSNIEITIDDASDAEDMFDAARALGLGPETLLVDNVSDPDDLPYGNRPGEVKGPDPTQHPGND